VWLFAAWCVLCFAACESPRAVPVPAAHAHHYDVTLTLDPERAHLTGHARLAVTGGGDGLSLGFANLRVDSLHVNGQPVAFDQRSDAIVVTTGRAARDTLTVDVWYVGAPHVGLRHDTFQGRSLVYTDGWADAVRGWLPGTHHPARPATLDLTLITPPDLAVVASGEAVRDRRDAEMRRTQWALDVPVPTYTFGFAAGPFTMVSDTAQAVAGPLPVSLYLLTDSDPAVEALRRAPEAVAFLEEMLGPYPFASLAVVQLPHPFAGMEFAAMPTVQADLFNTPGATWTHTPEAVMVHELAHQWVGNALAIADWRDLWLVEGMATYLTAWFYAQADGEDVALKRLQVLHEGPPDRRSAAPLYPDAPVAPTAYLHRELYNRGALVLHQLREELGTATFVALWQQLLEDAGTAPLSTARLEEAVASVAGVDAGTFFATYVYGRTYPTMPERFAPAEGMEAAAHRPASPHRPLSNDASPCSLGKSFPDIRLRFFDDCSIL
jgi:aminopeptidase N